MNAAPSLLIALGLTLGAVAIAPQDAPRRPAPATWSLAVEYVTPTRSDVPIPTATETVAVFEVPARKRLTLKTIKLPTGVVGSLGTRLAPLGLGQRVDDRSATAKTVYFGDGEAPIRLDPGVEFPAGAVVVMRFSKAITGLAGALFLNGLLESVETP